jgi:arylamine N-acetyltransferase
MGLPLKWPVEHDVLSSAQVSRYLTHLQLDPQTILSRSVDEILLSELQLAQLLHIPFDTTAVHIPEAISHEASSTEPFEFNKGPGMPLELDDMYTQVVEKGRGGYCFVLNILFAALLRNLGFQVKECLARAHPQHITEPWKNGWAWQAASHVRFRELLHPLLTICFFQNCLLVDTLSGRYLSDVGYGAGMQYPHPIPFEHNASVSSIAGTETYVLRQETLPGLSGEESSETVPGWTVYRHFGASVEDRQQGMPMYHFTLHTMAPADFRILNL